MKQRIFAVIQLANITKIMPFFTIFSPKTTQKNSSSYINKTTLLNSAHKNCIPSRLKEHPKKKRRKRGNRSSLSPIFRKLIFPIQSCLNCRMFRFRQIAPALRSGAQSMKQQVSLLEHCIHHPHCE